MKSKHLGKDTIYQLETYSPSYLDAVKRNSPDKAAIYFEKCLSMSDFDYERGIHQKAKSGLVRISD